MKLSTSPLVVCIAATLASHAAMAVTIIDTTPASFNAVSFVNAPPGGSNGGGPYSGNAMGFTMPAGSDYLLSSVQLRLNFPNLNSVATIEVYDTNSSGSPGSPLLTFVVPSYTTDFNTFTLTPNSPFTLENTKTYWVVVTNPASVPNSFTWGGRFPAGVPVGIGTSAGAFHGPPPFSTLCFASSHAGISRRGIGQAAPYVQTPHAIAGKIGAAMHWLCADRDKPQTGDKIILHACAGKANA
jgi:hypothetical protein